MGDTVFTPLYMVLKLRGVRFHFFRRVESLNLSLDRQEIASITMTRQVTLKEDNSVNCCGVRVEPGEYCPLIMVKGLPCWPSTPDYEQIVEGPDLRERQINLESPWSDWPGVGREVLTLGNDFDLVILGISIGAFEEICQSLIQANGKWKNMVAETQTIHTQALQLWMGPSSSDLGWPYPRTILSSFVDPLDTSSDFSHLIVREHWPSATAPNLLTYFCGPMLTPPLVPPRSDHDFPRRQRDEVENTVRETLRNSLGVLWPKGVDPVHGGINWGLLVDPANRSGDQRLYSQYWTANINPSDRYVLSVPDSIRHRLKADASGFVNLYLAGDWVSTQLNLGCVEAATMSGMEAARAICGISQLII
jgi:uncharacterized protein with NAD-binding domain and iron-sulfur cluster